MEHNTNTETEAALIAAIAHALWRSRAKGRLKTLEECRMAARDIVAHLKRARFEVDQADALEPHARLGGRAEDGGS